MAENVQVNCIKKRGGHYNPHERIEWLGGIHNSTRWYMSENDIIAESKKSLVNQRWKFFTSVGGKSAWVVVASHNGREYLKTEPDKFPDNNLLHLADCP